MFLHYLDASALPLAAAVINFPEGIGFTEVLLETLTETHGNDVSMQPIGDNPCYDKEKLKLGFLGWERKSKLPSAFQGGGGRKERGGGLRCNYECLEIPSAQSFLKELPKEQTLGDGACSDSWELSGFSSEPSDQKLNSDQELFTTSGKAKLNLSIGMKVCRLEIYNCQTSLLWSISAVGSRAFCPFMLFLFVWFVFVYCYIFWSSAAVADFLHAHETTASSARMSCSKGLFSSIVFTGIPVKGEAQRSISQTNPQLSLVP